MKKINLGWQRDRKENPINAPSIHVGALVGAMVHFGRSLVEFSEPIGRPLWTLKITTAFREAGGGALEQANNIYMSSLCF